MPDHCFLSNVVAERFRAAARSAQICPNPSFLYPRRDATKDGIMWCCTYSKKPDDHSDRTIHLQLSRVFEIKRSSFFKARLEEAQTSKKESTAIMQTPRKTEPCLNIMRKTRNIRFFCRFCSRCRLMTGYLFHIAAESERANREVITYTITTLSLLLRLIGMVWFYFRFVYSEKTGPTMSQHA